MLQKIDPKSSKKRSRGGSRGGPWGLPGRSRKRSQRNFKKTPKKYEKSREHDENWGPQNHRFFLFSSFFGSEKKSYKNAIVANERFSTRFGHRTHSGTLRASVLTSFWAPKWYFFERKNVPRKNYDFHRFFDDIFQKKNKKTKKTKSA